MSLFRALHKMITGRGGLLIRSRNFRFVQAARPADTPSLMRSPRQDGSASSIVQATRVPLFAFRLALLALYVAAASFAAENPLPAGAQEAFDHGRSAAEHGAWELAITFFTDAQQKAVHDPRVLYALGVAHAKAGHELAGVVWLNAYLAAAPKAPNAKAVQEEIVRLEGIARTSIKAVFEAALDAAHQISSDNSRKLRLLSIMQWQAFTDNWEEAQKTEEETSKLWCDISPDEAGELKPYIRSMLWKDRAFYLSEIGEFKTAQKALANVEDKFLNIEAGCEIAVGQSRMGDFASAEKTLKEVEARLNHLAELPVTDPKEGQKIPEQMLGLADAYAVNGLFAECQRVLTAAKKFAEQNNLDSDIRTRITAALAGDFKSKSLRAAPDAVKEWVDLATSDLFASQTSKHNLSKILKNHLEWANNDSTPDGLAHGLASVALVQGNGLRKINGLEKKFSEQWQAELKTRGAEVTENPEPAGNSRREPKRTVEAKIAGRISAVRVDVGNAVSAGDVLALLDDSALSAEFERAKASFERYKALFKNGAVSQADYDSNEARYRSASESLANAAIKAPIAGFVTKKSCDVGDAVEPGRLLFELAPSQLPSK